MWSFEEDLLEKEQASLSGLETYGGGWTEIEASGTDDLRDRGYQQHGGDCDWVCADSSDINWALAETDPIERLLQATLYQELSLPLLREQTWTSLQIVFNAARLSPFGRVESVDGEDVLHYPEYAIKFATWAPWPVDMRQRLVCVSEATRLKIEKDPKLEDKYKYVVRESVESTTTGSYRMERIGIYTSLDEANISALNRIDQRQPFMVRLAYIRRYFRKLRLGFDDYEEMDDTYLFDDILVNDVVREADELGEARVAWHVSQEDGTLIVSGFDWARDEFVVVEVKRKLMK